jgi:hypothetical protein
LSWDEDEEKAELPKLDNASVGIAIDNSTINQIIRNIVSLNYSFSELTANRFSKMMY